MLVTYIQHSGFFVETENCCLLFDYYRGKLPEPRKPLYIFSSHWHPDHYVPEIFRYGDQHPGTRYILDRGITAEPRDEITFLDAGATATIGDVTVRTLPSTDTGVGFWVQVDGKSLFHAGDLNLWLWGNRDTPEEAEAMRASFTSAVEPLRGARLDAAFLPLDPRQTEEQWWQGLDYYARLAEIGRIFPMHFWRKYSAIDKFLALPCAKPYRDSVVRLTKEGESFEV